MNTTFEEPGTYAAPGLLGRAIRFLAGVMILYMIYPPLIDHYDAVIGVGWRPHMLEWLPGTFIAVWLLPGMIDRGFTLNWGRRSQAVLGLLAGGLSIFCFFHYGSFWGPPLGWLLLLTIGSVLGHLALSFLVAGLFATPG
jgi:hypothetical protein